MLVRMSYSCEYKHHHRRRRRRRCRRHRHHHHHHHLHLFILFVSLHATKLSSCVAEQQSVILSTVGCLGFFVLDVRYNTRNYRYLLLRLNCPSVTFIHSVKTSYRIFLFFSPSGSQTNYGFTVPSGIAIFRWGPPNGGVECRWARQKSRF